jgi:glycosyltransferase involved in cell wall biosynthesis
VKSIPRSTVLSLFYMKPNKIGGAEMFARELSRQLDAEGWDSALCFISEPTAKVREYLDLPNVRLLCLPKGSENKVRARDLHEVLRSTTPQVLHLYFTGVLNALPWVGYLSGVRKILHTDQTSRPLGVHLQPSAWKRGLARVITWPVTAQVVASEYVLRCCETEQYVSPGKLTRIHNAVDTGRVSQSSNGVGFRERLRIPPDRFLVLQVSNLIHDKGCHVLLEALRLALGANPLLHVAVVGGGPERAKLEQQAKHSGVADHVSFAEACEDAFAEGAFSAADVLCQPSLWGEAFGFVLPEAMAHGKPVIATDVGGMPEVVEHDVTGLLVARDDAPALAEAILRLASDPELCKRLGCTGAAVVHQRFELRDRVADVLRLYGIHPEAVPSAARPDDLTMAQSAR